MLFDYKEHLDALTKLAGIARKLGRPVTDETKEAILLLRYGRKVERIEPQDFCDE